MSWAERPIYYKYMFLDYYGERCEGGHCIAYKNERFKNFVNLQKYIFDENEFCYDYEFEEAEKIADDAFDNKEARWVYEEEEEVLCC